ncbi:MAG: tetratricopeptide repeat protein [Bacteroidetes bacterium]|nr:tetratricopeptide repeat protein [Bacteroidota bacterium]
MDSLKKVLITAPDTTKIKILNYFSEVMVDVSPAKAIEHAREALKIALELKSKKSEALALHNIGNGYYNLADYKTALSYYIKSLNIKEALGGNKKGLLVSLGSIGNVFLDQHKPDEAYRYLNQALQIAKEIKHKTGTASALIAIGTVYSEKKNFEKALDYDFQALKIFEETNNADAVATCYNNIADAYQDLKDNKKARFYVNKALAIYEKEGNVYGMALALNNLGSFNEKTGNWKRALEYYKKGLDQAKKIGANDRILASYKGISASYKKLGQFKEALAVNELYQQMNDSIYNTESSKQIAEMQARFDTEKKAREIDLLTKDKKIKENELATQRLISGSIAVGGLLVLLLAIMAIRAYVQKRKISNELAVKNEKIENAYNIIEDQHNDIKGSIRYAKRLQEAILPTVAFNKTFSGNAFVLYRPKDIVSGDFYWIEEITTQTQNKILFAAVDCTGHGVPGAFMSIVGHNLLNQAVNEHGKTKPSDILDEINIGLSETLRQSIEDSAVKDGMDIALCSLDKQGDKYLLQFAGANNPVWIVKADQPSTLIEIKGDKYPIGVFLGEELHKFNNHEIELVKGDTLYVFTDGFADQFGGKKGKKYKYKPLQQLILSIQSETMVRQHDILNRALIEWKSDLEQVDDVLIIGVRV